MLPPIVPRLRTCGSPMVAAVSATTGQRARSRSDAATAWCVVAAPISMAPSCSRMPESSGMRATSMRVAGSFSRSFISGTRL